MAHDLFIKQGKNKKNAVAEDFALYLYKEPGWHGLGTVSPVALPFADVQRIAEMDFTAEMRDVFIGADLLPDDTRRGVVAVHPDRAPRILGNVSANYEPYQWDDVFQFIEGLSEFVPGGILYESAGLLGERGARGFVQIRLGDGIALPGNDVVCPYLYIFNSMDGTRALTIAGSTTRIVCKNTLQMAMKEKKTFRQMSFAIRHTKTISERVGFAAGNIRKILSAWDEQQNTMRAMAEKDVSNVAKMLESLTDAAFGKVEKDAGEKAKTRRANILDDVTVRFHSDTCEKVNGATLFAGFNAVTEHLQYASTVHGEGTAQMVARLESDLLGGIADKKAAVWEAAVGML